MADTLSDMLQSLADAGNFSHLSIISWRDGKFRASFVPSDIWGQGHGYGDTPVAAALAAIENAPKGRTVSRSKVHPSAPAKAIQPPAKAIQPVAVEPDVQGQTDEPAPRSLMEFFNNGET